ncbi:hypothetical protein [Rhizobium leguminosarum]|nr:hypothetical protein [Rhizobium leguminosarum]MBY2964707.1 hypothetical protein [Rhizobium leguminosarum]
MASTTSTLRQDNFRRQADDILYDLPLGSGSAIAAAWPEDAGAQNLA